MNINKKWGTVPVTLKGPLVREVFTEGYCGALAKALNHIAGCKMIRTDGHAAVITFDGKILDIEGVHTPDTFERKWHKAYPCEQKVLDRYYGGRHWRKAIPFAKLLVEKYL